MPNKPSKSWWDAKVNEVQQGNPEYTKEQVDKTVGDIFYNKLPLVEKEKAMSHSSHLLQAISIVSAEDRIHIDKFQGDDDDHKFGYVYQDDADGGYYFTWHDTLEETLASLQPDETGMPDQKQFSISEARNFVESQIRNDFDEPAVGERIYIGSILLDSTEEDADGERGRLFVEKVLDDDGEEVYALKVELSDGDVEDTEVREKTIKRLLDSARSVYKGPIWDLVLPVEAE